MLDGSRIAPATLWTELPRFIGLVEPECDNALHGYECRCLANIDADGDPIDEELEQLYEDLEEAEDDLQSAESAIEDAEDRRDDADRWVRQLQRKVDEVKAKRAPVPGQQAAAA